MTPEERQMLADLFDRVKPAGATPRDADAEAFINDAVRAAPFAPYVLSQTVLVQQRALEAAAHRIAELEAATRQGAEQSQEHGSFLGNLGKTIFGGGAPAAPPRPSYDASAYQRGPAPAPGPARRPRPKAILLRRRSRRAIRRSPALGRSASPVAAASSRTPPRPRPASRAASRSAISWAACSAAMRGGGLFGGSGVGGAGLFGGGVPGGGNPTEVTEINNFYEDRPDRGSDANFQGSDPNAPGVQDANFDDSDFDSSDGSSFDDGGGLRRRLRLRS